MNQVAEISVNSPLPKSLDYLIPDNMLNSIKVGDRVKVPLGRGGRVVDGVVLNLHDNKIEKVKYKAIAEESEDPLQLPSKYIDWGRWLGNYYHYPLGQVFQSFFPPLKKNGRKTKKKSVIPDVELKEPHKLNDSQIKVVKDIIASPGFGVHLIHGVTGSGKTEVYLELIENCLMENKQAVFLLPEISLTPQLIRRFAERFGDLLAVIHSQLTDRERTNQWWEMVDGKKRILIGARSALFCPIPELGLIVIDEEHEASYKQEEKLKYHARDASIVLAKSHNVPVILGSATPSIESYQKAKNGKFHYHSMPKRANENPLPNIQVLDMREEENSKNTLKNSNEEQIEIPYWMSPTLYNSLEENLKKKEQSALFLNRRGISQAIQCSHCGNVEECPNCAISLSLHAKTHLLCHYCDYHAQLKDNCSECSEGEMSPMGMGTEQIELDLAKLFPNARLARADRDEIASREDMENLIKSIEDLEVDILIGTQMIAKGLDFPKLTLVSLVLADIGFNLPDFRAAERSFQLLTQVSGRAGRHELEGKVIIQTYNPEHRSVEFATTANYDDFAQLEISDREELNYPPFHRLASIRVQGLDLYKVEETSQLLAKKAQAMIEHYPKLEAVQVLGPAQAPIFKLRSKFRYHLLLKCNNPGLLGKFCESLMQNDKWVPSGVQILVDMDPMQLM
ncbi:MAG: primosomal protein N' [Bdellovibrionales bacterium]